MSTEYEWAATVERQAREIDRLRAELAETRRLLDNALAALEGNGQG